MLKPAQLGVNHQYKTSYIHKCFYYFNSVPTEKMYDNNDEFFKVLIFYYSSSIANIGVMDVRDL